jgi:hypothetical protein
MRPVLIKTDCHEQRHHDDATTDSKTSAHKSGSQSDEDELPGFHLCEVVHDESA